MSSDKHISGFTEEITNGYTFKGDSMTIGGAMLDGEALPGVLVKIPLSTINRHGLIAGATGTGKTKTLQGIVEQLSANGVSTVLMDIKGDLSGLAAKGNGHPKIDERHKSIGVPWTADSFPVELLSISQGDGVQLRSTVTEFGPVLFSRILDLNNTQSGIVSLAFKYADDRNYPLIDLKDFKTIIQYLVSEKGKEEIESEYGRVSKVSVSAIMRKIIEIEQQGAESFFGEKSFEVNDLMRTDKDGKGIVNIVRLTDIQDKPHLFSTFMLSLLDEIFETLPEAGDLDKPKLVLFIDEAHLIFRNATKTLLSQIDLVIKLIRSKGVGVIFCTQQPSDLPAEVLSQLGLKVQHALRAFTARDRKNIKLTAENYPITEYYNTKEELTKLGIGEALITCLNHKGIPTPLVRTLLCAPASRMDILTTSEIKDVVSKSSIVKKYEALLDRESAFELLQSKMQKQKKEEALKPKHTKRKRSKNDSNPLEDFMDTSAGKQVSRSMVRVVERGILGVLKKLF
jgi:DNA helicase HerA-like ATPase